MLALCATFPVFSPLSLVDTRIELGRHKLGALVERQIEVRNTSSTEVRFVLVMDVTGSAKDGSSGSGSASKENHSGSGGGGGGSGSSDGSGGGKEGHEDGHAAAAGSSSSSSSGLPDNESSGSNHHAAARSALRFSTSTGTVAPHSVCPITFTYLGRLPGRHVHRVMVRN